MLNIDDSLKKLFKQNNVEKKLVVTFQDGTTIPMERLDGSDSFRFTESLISSDKFKFGKCESSVVEFSTYGLGNVKGQEITVGIEVSGINVPLGVFVIDSCQKEGYGSEKRKIVAYSKDMDFNVSIPESELFKRRMTLEVNYPYKFNPACYLFSITEPNPALAEGAEEQSLTHSTYGRRCFYKKGEKTLQIDYETAQYDISDLIEDGTIDVHTLWWIGLLSKERFENWMRQYYFQLEQAILDAKYGMDVTEEEFMEQAWNNYGYAFNSMIRAFYETMFEYSKSSVVYPYFAYDESEYSNINIYLDIPVAISSVTLVGSKRVTIPRFSLPTSNIKKVTYEYPETIMQVDRKLQMYGWQYDAVDSFSEIDLNELFESAIELTGTFGRYNRYGEFELVGLGTGGVFPKTDLYPDETLYPEKGFDDTYTKSMMRSLWIDDEYTKPYAYVSATYTDTEGNEDRYAREWIIPERDYNENPKAYQGYNIGENYIIQNNQWTTNAIRSVLQIIADRVKDVRYIPVDFDAIGLPYLEAGDRIQIKTDEQTINTYILRRTMTGINSLADSIESK